MGNLQKRLAAKIAKVGKSKVKVSPLAAAELKEAITKADVRSLIARKAISIVPAKSPSRFRAKARRAQRKKGRQRGHGTRKGAKTARTPRKRNWINNNGTIRKCCTS